MSRSVLFVVTELGRGGAETQLTRVALALRARGWSPAVLSLMTPVGYVDLLREGGVPVASAGLSRGRPSLAGAARALRFAHAWRPDVVCAFLYHAVIFGVGAATWLRVPLVASIRDPSFGSERRLRIVAGLVRAGRVRRLVTNSDTVEAQLRGSGLFAEEALDVIPNGIDVDAQPPLDEAERAALRASLGVEPEAFLWLCIGNFQAPKDHPNILEAFGKLRARRDDAPQLRLVGLGDAPPDIARRLHELRPHVRHIGERRDVLKLLDASDALLMGSRSEGLPNVILEAYTMRRPVVATAVGGIPELVDEGVHGLLVPARDPAALAAAMSALMDRTPEERARMGAAGRERVERRYALPRVVDRWEALFEQALQRS